MSYKIHTFGCKVNTYDSGLISKNLQSFPQDYSGVHVLNTCAVTAEATKEAVKMIRRIKSKEPLATVVVTGCAAQVDTDQFENLPGADLIVANSHKGLLPQILSDHFKGSRTQKVFKSNIFKKEDLEMDGGEEASHTRSYLKIQDGCNSFCTFCIIPYARGKSRSIPMRDLVRRVQELEASGRKEIVLTGVHIGDYEDETRPLGRRGLEDLVEEILKNSKTARFRLTSLEPIEVTDALLDLYQDPRLCPHFHMSIQSGSTTVLRDMKRKYDQQAVRESLLKIQSKVPGSFVGMDVIAGFPTETEELFEETYQTLSETPWTRLHVFPYSERTGTKAAVMTESIPWTKRKERAEKLRALSLHRHQAEALKQTGSIKTVLVQKAPSKGGHGMSADYWNVQIQNLSEGAAPANTYVQVRIEGMEWLPTNQDTRLRGVIL